MKNALMAVLFIAVYYEHTRAQDIPQRSPGYIKYQGIHPTNAVGKGSSTKNTTTDGAVTTDKLADDIFISNITADGTVSTDKLADDIVNSMNDGNWNGNANALPVKKLTALVSYGAAIVNPLTYARYILQAELQYVESVSSNVKRTGWLQYKVD